MSPTDYDDATMRDVYGIAWDFYAEEWADADLIDPETGERVTGDEVAA